MRLGPVQSGAVALQLRCYVRKTPSVDLETIRREIILGAAELLRSEGASLSPPPAMSHVRFEASKDGGGGSPFWERGGESEWHGRVDGAAGGTGDALEHPGASALAQSAPPPGPPPAGGVGSDREFAFRSPNGTVD